MVTISIKYGCQCNIIRPPVLDQCRILLRRFSGSLVVSHHERFDRGPNRPSTISEWDHSHRSGWSGTNGPKYLLEWVDSDHGTKQTNALFVGPFPPYTCRSLGTLQTMKSSHQKCFLVQIAFKTTYSARQETSIMTYVRAKLVCLK